MTELEIIDRQDPDRTESRCDRCHGQNEPFGWWVDSDRWRIACTAFGGTVEEPADNPFLCPVCFIGLWEGMTGFVATWRWVPDSNGVPHLVADAETIRCRGTDEWFAEHDPGWTSDYPPTGIVR